MSGVLLDASLAFVRGAFTKAELQEVNEYGGEFSSAELGKVSFNCPAVFITVLGWSPAHDGQRISGRTARKTRMAAFVVAKSPKRATRMRQAMQLADKLSLVLRNWMPAQPDAPYTIGPLEDDANCENLYARAVDEAGLAVWLVDWEQVVKPTTPLPQLADWVRVDMENTARVPAPVIAPAPPAPAPSTLVVTDKIIFPPQS